MLAPTHIHYPLASCHSTGSTCIRNEFVLIAHTAIYAIPEAKTEPAFPRVLHTSTRDLVRGPCSIYSCAGSQSSSCCCSVIVAQAYARSAAGNLLDIDGPGSSPPLRCDVDFPRLHVIYIGAYICYGSLPRKVHVLARVTASH